MVVASFALLAAIAMAVAGCAVLALDSFARDDDGFLNSPTEEFQAPGYAVTAEDIDLSTDPVSWVPEELLGETRITAESLGSGGIFVGIAPAAKADVYLRGVRHSEVREIRNGAPRYAERQGFRRPGPPTRSEIWVASSAGVGPQAVDWEAESGVWSVVVMNENGRAGMDFEAKAGAELGWLTWAGLALLAGGLLLGIGGGVAVYFLVGRSPAAPPAASA
jgi:hypothetical protein